MRLLYSNIRPLGVDENQSTVTECISSEIAKSDQIDIAVGYVSKASLLELDRLIEEHNVKFVSLIIGMYYIDGMPEGTYHTAMALNEKWRSRNIGEILITRTFTYHGKLYAFYKNDEIFSAVIGSANLGVLKLEANNRRQYEVSAVTYDKNECKDISKLIAKLKDQSCSVNIAEIADLPIVREVNTSLTDIELVEQIPQTEVKIFSKHLTNISFTLPIKVPAFSERHMDDNRHYTKSNLNVSYAAPRSARKSRDWFETQLTVSNEITRHEGYPEKKVPFFVITDDGYMFKAHTTSSNNKQFSAVGDELILGRWIKGRLAAAGLVTPVNDTQADKDRLGMITKEMLTAYGCDTLKLTKTNQTMEDDNENVLDVWMLSFEAEEWEEEGIV